MTVRVLTRFAGELIDAVHDSATDRAVTVQGSAIHCTLAAFLRAANAERLMHAQMGLRYRVSQTIHHGPTDGPSEGEPP